MISLFHIAALLMVVAVMAEPIPEESVARKEKPASKPMGLPSLPHLPQMPALPAIPSLPSLPSFPMPAVPPAVPQFLDRFTDGLSKMSAALRGPNPLKSLAPQLFPARMIPGNKPDPSTAEPSSA